MTLKSISKPPPLPNFPFPPPLEVISTALPMPPSPSVLRPKLGVPTATPAGSILGAGGSWG